MWEPLKYYTVTMASAADTCVITLPHAYNRVFVHCPTMSTAADRTVFGSVDGTNYYCAVYAISSGVTSPSTIVIGSGVTNQIIELPMIAPYIRLVASAAASVACTYHFICS